MTRPPLIVFSDLDGTLLDHATYSPAPARAALDRLRAAAIPLVLASSKTAVEIDVLRREIGCEAYPAIVENGAGLLEADPTESDTDYTRLRAALDQVTPDLRAHFAGFADLGVDGVALATGLAPEDAANASRRQFSEPGLWNGSNAELDSFLQELEALGVSARHGGRFLTLSFGGTKADRMAEVASRYDNPPKLALGDAPNDREMIEAADYGVIVANPHGTPLPPLPGEAAGRIHRTSAPGPEGWNSAVLDLLDSLNI
ncbi:HAD-IIB family hydrolase [Tropicimonas marinistellae]|uniref:HAD-IIB family hydrolase n=1 Tax=Tropicimonas marinistellae TaxID=1739787 RepID=UPI0008320FB9|nr:HAD hydrolase family protein [Tropicimonas marinistellae]